MAYSATVRQFFERSYHPVLSNAHFIRRLGNNAWQGFHIRMPRHVKITVNNPIMLTQASNDGCRQDHFLSESAIS